MAKAGADCCSARTNLEPTLNQPWTDLSWCWILDSRTVNAHQWQYIIGNWFNTHDSEYIQHSKSPVSILILVSLYLSNKKECLIVIKYQLIGWLEPSVEASLYTNKTVSAQMVSRCEIESFHSSQFSAWCWSQVWTLFTFMDRQCRHFRVWGGG